MNRKKKYFNLRLFFVGFLGMILGILTFFNLLNLIWLNAVTIWFILFFLIFISSIVGLVVFIVKTDLRKYIKYVTFFIILFVAGASLFGLKVNSLTKLKSYDGECVVEGVVDNYYYQSNNLVLILDNVKINNEKAKSKVTIVSLLDIPVNKELTLGDEVTLTTELSLKSLVTNKIDINQYVDNNVYSGYVMNSAIELVNKKPNIIYGFKQQLRSVLNNGLNSENATIAYGVLVGDKTGLDDEVQDAFSFAGISHILAVSGLHVGFLVAVITFLLNLCRVGRRARFFVTSILLIFYSVLCGLTPSILRASFMAIILLLAGVLGEEYDGLNSLGFAGILILLFFPLDLFSAGFQLSFMCVFMIITLADKMTKVLMGWKVPEKIASAISISLCVTLGSSIILANTMHEVSLISIVANLIVIPLFGVTYPLLFLLALISMCIPILSGILIIPQFLLHIIKLVANIFANINFAHFRVFHLGYLILFVFVILSVFVKFFMGKKLIKLPICVSLSLICILLVVLGLQPVSYKTDALYTNYQYVSNSAVITTKSGKKFLIGVDDYSSTAFLTDLKINHLNAVILPDFEINKIDRYIEILHNIKVDEFVIPNNDNYVDIVFEKLNKVTNVKLTDNYHNEIATTFIKDKDELVCGTEIHVSGKSLLFINGITKLKLETISEYCSTTVDYVIANKSKYDFDEYGIPYNHVVHSNILEFETNKSISLKDKSYYMLKL